MKKFFYVVLLFSSYSINAGRVPQTSDEKKEGKYEMVGKISRVSQTYVFRTPSNKIEEIVLDVKEEFEEHENYNSLQCLNCMCPSYFVNILYAWITKTHYKVR